MGQVSTPCLTSITICSSVEQMKISRTRHDLVINQFREISIRCTFAELVGLQYTKVETVQGRSKVQVTSGNFKSY